MSVASPPGVLEPPVEWRSNGAESRPSTRRRGVNAPLVALALVLLGASAFGLVYGWDGRLESCGGDCAHTALARTQHVTVVWALVAGGALALVAAAVAIAAVIRARQPLPVEAVPLPRGGRFSALAGLTVLIAVWVTIGSLAYVDRVDKQAQHRQDLSAAYRTHQAQEHGQAARSRLGHH